MKVGMFMSIRNYCYLKTILCRIAYSKTDSIDRYRAFINSKVTSTSHLLVECIVERIVPTTLGILYLKARCRLVHMSLHDMTVKATIHHHATLHIHSVTHIKKAKIGTFDGLFHSSYRISTILQTNHGKAYAIMRYTLVYLQLIYKATFKRQMQILLLLDNAYNCGALFYYS